ncbi:hypothetical protein J6590_063655, partial [Homalodisca vitripennis]
MATLPNKKGHDRELLLKIFDSVDIKGNDLQFFQLGKTRKDDKPRPIKIILPSPHLAIDFFKKFSQVNPTTITPALSSISVSHDRTLQERNHLNKLRKSLEDRIQKGETDLTI